MFASLVISANAADRFQQQTGVNNYCLDLIMILGSTLGRWLPRICFCSSEAVCLVWPVMGARTGTRLVCTVLRTSPPPPPPLVSGFLIFHSFLSRAGLASSMVGLVQTSGSGSGQVLWYSSGWGGDTLVTGEVSVNNHRGYQSLYWGGSGDRSLPVSSQASQCQVCTRYKIRKSYLAPRQTGTCLHSFSCSSD